MKATNIVEKDCHVLYFLSIFFQALVDSVGEKERLLRRSQQNLTEDAKAQLAEMDTLLADNSRLKRLLREKEGELFSSSLPMVSCYRGAEE